MNRAYSQLTIKTVDEDQRLVTGIASTPSVDLCGDIVEPLGCLNIGEMPIPFLLDHAHGDNVGVVEWARATKKGIEFRARVAKISTPGTARDLVDRAWHLLKAGLRPAISIGFKPVDVERLPNGGAWVKSWRWLELSAVSVAAQPEARVTGLKSAPHLARGRVVRLSVAERARGKVIADSRERAARRARLGIVIPRKPVKF